MSATQVSLVIHPRSVWGARHDNGAGSAPLPAREVWLHHSVTTPPSSSPLETLFARECAHMRQLEDIGESRFGTGISYTWLIFPSGDVFEGHGVNRQGTHTGGRNDISRAICLVGNYETARPTSAQLTSVAKLLVTAHLNGWITSPALRGGHRDVKPWTGDSIVTACPGNNAYSQISTINQLALEMIVEEDDMTPAQANQLQQIYDVLSRVFVRTGRGAGDVIADISQQLGPDHKAWTEDILRRVQSMHVYGFRAFNPDEIPPPDWRQGGDLTFLEEKLNAVKAEITSELREGEATLLEAVREIQTGQVDVTALAAALVPLLPPETTPEQIAAAVAAEQSRRMAD